MTLITCYAKLNFYFSDLRSLLPRRDTYVNGNELLAEQQYGFRAQHSTE